MTTWFTKNLGDAMLAEDSLGHIKTLFTSAYEAANHAQDMAVFVRHESEGRLHCDVKVYFTPAAAAVAKAVDAVSCQIPSLEGLGLLVGSQQAWELLSRP